MAKLLGMQWHNAEVASVWQVQGVTKFVANRNLPLALKEDISRHLEGSQVIHNEQVEGDVFSRLSHTLQVAPPGHSPHPYLCTRWAVDCHSVTHGVVWYLQLDVHWPSLFLVLWLKLALKQRQER